MFGGNLEPVLWRNAKLFGGNLKTYVYLPECSNIKYQLLRKQVWFLRYHGYGIYGCWMPAVWAEKAALSFYPIFTKQPYVQLISLMIKSRNAHNLDLYFGLGLVFWS